MDESSSEQPAGRRAALARAHQRRRLTAVGTILAIIVIVLVALNRSGPTGRPPAPEARAAVPAPRGEAARRLGAADAAVDRVLAYTPYVARGSHRRKEVALTFDDGPGPTTPALLRYLMANGVPATFFLVGKAIGEHPETVRRESDAGFTLGTHTDSHARLASKTPADQQQEILTGADRITRFTGHAVRFFRPPYGAFDANTLSILRAERMLMVLWSVDTRDFSARSSDPIVFAALSGSRAGAVVLLHDGPGPRPQTLKAVRRIVTSLRREGYRLVSLPKLLRDDPPRRDQPQPHSLAG
ncbi:MAG: peptidoglycan-N-acetylglucosamine deacetylase [Solirubrobacteraceae bacterium]|nr:peptidoglycan-N-acetylglucosamine deacetylase [Solirubrobacteraceae bacterium]